MKFLPSFDSILMFIHMQMEKDKQNLLLVTFKKMDKARFECYLLNYLKQIFKCTVLFSSNQVSWQVIIFMYDFAPDRH